MTAGLWSRQGSCPEPEVRAIVQLAASRTSGSKGTLESWSCSCRFGSDVRFKQDLRIRVNFRTATLEHDPSGHAPEFSALSHFPRRTGSHFAGKCFSET